MSDDFKKFNCIGIMGGTFNPIHNGHLMIAKAAITQFKDIEKVVFIPNKLPAYKEINDIESDYNRYNMINEAIKDCSDFSISKIEIQREGITYSYDTLKEIIGINPNIKIYFIIGADSLYNFKKWYRYKDILDMCTLLVAIRNTDETSMNEFVDALKLDKKEISVHFLKTINMDVSSSEIREKLSQGDCDNVDVPDGVLDYILQNKLYGCGKKI